MPRLFVRFPASERVQQDLALQVVLAGTAQAVAELEMMGGDRARRTSLLRLLRRDGNQNGGNTQHLYLAGNDDHHAVAERAASGQDRPIGFGTQNQASHFRGGPFVEIAKVLGVSHKAQVHIAQPGDDPLVRQFAQTIDGEDAINVLVSVPVIEMIVRNHQLRTLHVAWDNAPAIVTLDIKGLLLAQMNTGGGNQRKNTLPRLACVWRVWNTPFRHSHKLSIPSLLLPR